MPDMNYQPPEIIQPPKICQNQLTIQEKDQMPVYAPNENEQPFFTNTTDFFAD